MSESLAPAAGRVRLIVDASAAIKWYVNEEHAEAARRLQDETFDLHVPDLFFPEIGNILWKKVRRGNVDATAARAIVKALAVFPMTTHPSGPLWEAAFEIALQTDRTVYDSLYVALAVSLDARLVTADQKLFNSLQAGIFALRVHWIDQVESLVTPT